ncbi:aromatic amino acid DMT transporter YddG [Brackiella oedipodis]|uniref:aromatic amino acid DMT transporter YddG n=1 Tax=Brackiella oedipodis TaxID=124225 RepID=UPI00049181CE|nr:aromatic amino acid DMT transporter YddG [Brackiella oedipodis]
MTQHKATIIGLTAILLWSTIVGAFRGASAYLGATGGAAMIYSGAFLLLLLTLGRPRLRTLPRPYLLIGSVLFVSYELCLALSIGYAHSNRQAIEVSIVNYLWPALTMTFAILFNKQKASWLFVPGLFVAITGVAWVLGGDQGLDIKGMLLNIQDNPRSYGMAFIGAIIWSTYCVITIRMAKGQNGVTLFIMLTALALWCKFFLMGGEPMHFSFSAIGYLALAACAMGFGYAAWNVGILHGNMTIMAGASYFIPVISSALSALVLGTPLPFSFWKGAAMVCLGSILCWQSTRVRT